MYRVSWEMDFEAGSAKEAAELALAVQRDPDSIATMFEVTGLDKGRPPTVMVDLSE